jgi:hypothetical protein
LVVTTDLDPDVLPVNVQKRSQIAKPQLRKNLDRNEDKIRSPNLGSARGDL